MPHMPLITKKEISTQTSTLSETLSTDTLNADNDTRTVLYSSLEITNSQGVNLEKEVLEREVFIKFFKPFNNNN